MSFVSGQSLPSIKPHSPHHPHTVTIQRYPRSLNGSASPSRTPVPSPFAPRWNDRRPHASPYSSPGTRRRQVRSMRCPLHPAKTWPSASGIRDQAARGQTDRSNISTAFEVTGTRPIQSPCSGSLRPCVQQPDYVLPDHRCAPRRGSRSGCDACVA